MNFTSDKEIERIGRGIEDLSLPKPDWTHAAHFAAAVWLLTREGRDAISEMPDLIRAYNEATGVANTDHDGYHHTITIASLRAARDSLSKYAFNLKLYEKVNAILATAYCKPDWLLEYWSKNALFSVEARHYWLRPDLKQLPFA